MSQPAECLRAGIEALSQERYLEAIDRLESYCYRCSRNEDPQFQPNRFPLAHICLVKAYLGSGDCERALALCQDVATGSHLMARHWAYCALSSLQQAEFLTWHERAALALPPVPMGMLDEAVEPRVIPVSPDNSPNRSSVVQAPSASMDPPLPFSHWLIPTAVSS